MTKLVCGEKAAGLVTSDVYVLLTKLLPKIVNGGKREQFNGHFPTVLTVGASCRHNGPMQQSTNGMLRASQSGASHRRGQLGTDRSFWGISTTQFLGAFNDNLFKQLVLLLALTTSAESPSTAEHGVDLQAVAMFVFSVPFLLFSGFAGYLSDQFSKTSVIILCKIAEIVIMVLGLVALLTYSSSGFGPLLVVLFMMGTQSAFFGPGKYGILPEMLANVHIQRANAIVLMLTFVAIILGTASAGYLSDIFQQRRWLISCVCIGLAIIGTGTSLAIRRMPPADRDIQFGWSSLAIPGETLRVLRADWQLVLALAASCGFWLVAGIAHLAVNAFGKEQLQLADGPISLMVASIALGMSVGSLVAGLRGKDVVDFRFVRIGAWGMVGSLALLALTGTSQGHTLGFGGCCVTLLVLGSFTGMFAVPVQAFIQSRPPEKQKGRMVAAMNLTNWVAIVISAITYGIFDVLTRFFEWPRSVTFGLCALLTLPVALFYRPRNVV